MYYDYGSIYFFLQYNTVNSTALYCMSLYSTHFDTVFRLQELL
jgi:hypothetical protein